ncbi:hypothetical protein [Pseudoxanthomonas mexicana]|uniref:hypothetical protein n=1 Tax=Pseudoxanthomonas mexicana TaxID=128785 RepID=UPI00398AAC06
MAIIVSEEQRTIRAEIVSPRIVINWNPDTDTGSVHFQVDEMEYRDGVFHQLTPRGEYALTLQELMQRSVIVGEQEISPLLVIGYIKQLFADLHAEYAAD